MIAMLDLDAHPHNSRPQVHMGAMNGFVEFEFIVDREGGCPAEKPLDFSVAEIQLFPFLGYMNSPAELGVEV